MAIRLLTESGDFLRLVEDENSLRPAIVAGKVHISRDSHGNSRVAILMADEQAPLVGKSKQAARDSYRGIEKYTWNETLATGNVIALKRYRPQQGDFVRDERI